MSDVLPFDDADADSALDRRASTGRRRSAVTNRWMRWLHVYTSMISLIIVLFFGVTGLTLNHPSWTLGDRTDRSTSTGTLPASFRSGDAVDFLTVSEFVRRTYGVSGEVSAHDLSGNEGTISYRAPGYAADLVFTVDTGTYRLVVEQQGFVGVMNDLHKGRDAPGSWKWVIDISAGLLVAVSLTGLGIQLFQRKRRTRALVFAVLGLVVVVVLAYIALA
ncbi:MAG: PepSY-associated TM helix domain-containing protein [Actinomycetota bacterium]